MSFFRHELMMWQRRRVALELASGLGLLHEFYLLTSACWQSHCVWTAVSDMPGNNNKKNKQNIVCRIKKNAQHIVSVSQCKRNDFTLSAS